jgi:hypothetical protein
MEYSQICLEMVEVILLEGLNQLERVHFGKAIFLHHIDILPNVNTICKAAFFEFTSLNEDTLGMGL